MPSHPTTAHFTPTAHRQPRVLVADDDPGSCRFLCDGLQLLGAHVEACTDGATALARARAEPFDLLLLDCRMPGGGALHVLTRLRNDTQARSAQCPAVATSAELAPDTRQALLAAGFSKVLLKPCALAELQRLLAAVAPTRPDVPLLDDGAALVVTGDPTTMRALRLLLREELALLQQELEPLSHDRTRFGERLHRLRSSCGFCGATALATQAARLQQQLARQQATDVVMARFRATLLTTLQALDAN